MKPGATERGPSGRTLPRSLGGWLFAVFLPLTMALCGCRTAGFYAQAIAGQSAIVLQKKPVAKMLQDPNTPAELRRKLELIRQICQFAESELQLPAGKHYRHYADLGRPYVVWDIYAAPEFSLEAKTWWYPFVGRLSYRGYFNEAKARRYAQLLSRKGYEVFVGGVDAYSTLGWFRDPILSTFVRRSEEDLVDLIFHELAHQKVFIEGDSDLDEAFASTVAREGVRRWLAQRGTASALAAWQERIRREDGFLALVLGVRTRLEALYTESAPPSSHPLPPSAQEILRERKEAIFRDLRGQYQAWKNAHGGSSDLDPWFDLPVNNARLNAEATYYALMPALQNLLAFHGNDLDRFYEAVRRLGRLKPADRLAALKQFAAAAMPSRHQSDGHSDDPYGSPE